MFVERERSSCEGWKHGLLDGSLLQGDSAQAIMDRSNHPRVP